MRSITPTPISTATPTITTISWVWPIRRPRKSTVLVVLTSSKRMSVLQNHWTIARSRNARPIDIRISWRKPARFFRIGPQRRRSKSIPRSAVATIAQKTATTSGRPQVTFTRYAMYAPKVRKSPWAKLTSLRIP
jgi:hypothetical protein